MPRPMGAIIHLTEMVVHGADFAVGIDRPELLDEALCSELLETMHAMGGVDAFRVPGVFDAEVDVPQDAPPSRRLLGYLGRAL